MPAIWRALTSSGNRLTTWKIVQATSGETIAAASTPSFASSSSLPSKARLEIRIETVKPTPATAPPPAITGQLRARCRPPKPWPACEPARAQDAQGLPDDVPERYSERDRRADGITEQLPVDMDAGVGEREDGNDEVARPRVKLVLKPLVGGDRRRDAPPRATSEFGSRLLTERTGQLGRTLEIAACGLIGRRYEPDRQSGDEWIDTGLEQSDPERDAEHDGGLGSPRERHPAQSHQEHGEEADRERAAAHLDALRCIRLR